MCCSIARREWPSPPRRVSALPGGSRVCRCRPAKPRARMMSLTRSGSADRRAHAGAGRWTRTRIAWSSRAGWRIAFLTRAGVGCCSACGAGLRPTATRRSRLPAGSVIRPKAASARGIPQRGTVGVHRSCSSAHQCLKEGRLTRGAYCDRDGLRDRPRGRSRSRRSNSQTMERQRDTLCGQRGWRPDHGDARPDGRCRAEPRDRGDHEALRRAAAAGGSRRTRRVLDAYRVQRHDVEDAMNQMLGRDRTASPASAELGPSDRASRRARQGRV